MKSLKKGEGVMEATPSLTIMILNSLLNSERD